MSSDTVLVNKVVLEEILRQHISLSEALDSYSSVRGARDNEDEAIELISKLYEY